jgi:hypothetical protein
MVTGLMRVKPVGTNVNMEMDQCMFHVENSAMSKFSMLTSYSICSFTTSYQTHQVAMYSISGTENLNGINFPECSIRHGNC